jgi:hypothetical protein
MRLEILKIDAKDQLIKNIENENAILNTKINFDIEKFKVI